MRKPLVAGNWKMHGSRAENASLLDTLLDLLKPESRAEVMVCPPFVYLWEAARLLKDSDVALGAQSVCAEALGAFTGEVSGAMLRDVGCRYVLVGHSERRQLFGESDALVARKFVAAQSQGLVPVLCVGETLDEREADRTTEVVSRQIDAVLAVSGVRSLAKAVIAYEPVWAIGTGRTASPEQAQQVHAMIRAKVAALDATIAASVRILYGGSVKASNARELFAMADIDGGLVG
ncbi:MAG: triose-phosphate isomerase, partial [Steroidobacteraceae bacterium]|nr:triose-phosphate isomerase [Steroidobacteraceae bacterium]